MDNQVYFYVAERVAAGVPPHVSLLDHKHALAAMLSGWAMVGGRALGVDDVLAVRALSIAVAALVPPAVWSVTLRLTSIPLAAHLAAFVALSFDDFFSQGAAGVRPQVFMAAFLAQSFAALAKGRTGFAGALSIAAFLCWQPALLGFGSTLLALLVACGIGAPTWRYALGGVAVFAGYEAYFWIHGALYEQLFQSYVLRSDVSGLVIPPVADSLRFVLRDGRWGLGAAIAIPATYLAATVAVLPIALFKWRPAWAWLRSDPLPAAVLLTSAATLAFTFVDHQAYPDRFVLQPFVAIAAGVVWGGVSWWILSTVAGASRGARIGSLVFMSLALLTATSGRTSFPLREALTLSSQRELAQRTYALGVHYGPVWAIGCPHILALDRAENHDPVALVIDPKVQAYLMKDRGEAGYRPERGMPAVVITSRGREESTLPWLRKEYWPVRDEPFNDQGIRVWLRKECLASPRKCTVLFECAGTPRCRSGLAPPSDPAP